MKKSEKILIVVLVSILVLLALTVLGLSIRWRESGSKPASGSHDKIQAKKVDIMENTEEPVTPTETGIDIPQTLGNDNKELVEDFPASTINNNTNDNGSSSTESTNYFYAPTVTDKREQVKEILSAYFREGTKAEDFTKSQIKKIMKIKTDSEEKLKYEQDKSNMEKILNETKLNIDNIPTANELLDQLVDRLEAKQDKQSFIKKNLFSIVITGILALVLAAFILILFFNKADKKKLLELTAKIDSIQNNIKNSDDNFTLLQKEIADNSRDLSSLEDKIRNQSISPPVIKPERPGKYEPIAPGRPIPEIIPDDPVEDFNNWAASPYSKQLPKRFYYIKGDIKLRTEQSFDETPEATSWICNRKGPRKYLLPNPCFFDDLTNISKFYKMDITKLKSKGQNMIKIKTPCEMSEKGWIEYPGELILL